MVPIYEQIMDQIKNQIINKELREGTSLTTVRSLSSELRISALTVKKAYDKLEQDGFVKTIHGKGTFILETDQEVAKEARYKLVEDALSKVVEQAKSIGMKDEEIKDMLDILLEDLS